jgi:hypothetical protein
LGTVLIPANVVHSVDAKRHNDAMRSLSPELRKLADSQAYDSSLDAGPFDALFYVFSENHGVHFADDRPLYNQILDTEGFDHTTGCDTAFSDHHAGAMICAGFAMMEIDHEY